MARHEQQRQHTQIPQELYYVGEAAEQEELQRDAHADMRQEQERQQAAVNPAAEFAEDVIRHNPEIVRPDVEVPDLRYRSVKSFTRRLSYLARKEKLTPDQIEKRIRFYRRAYGPFGEEDELKLSSWWEWFGMRSREEFYEGMAARPEAMDAQIEKIRSLQADLQPEESFFDRTERGEALDETRTRGLEAADKWMMTFYLRWHPGLKSGTGIAALELPDRERLLFYYLIENGYKKAAGKAAVYVSQTGYVPNVEKISKVVRDTAFFSVGKIYELTCSLRSEIDGCAEQDHAMEQELSGMREEDAEELRGLMARLRDAVRDADCAFIKYKSHPKGLVGKKRLAQIARQKQEALAGCIDEVLAYPLNIDGEQLAPDGTLPEKSLSDYTGTILSWSGMAAKGGKTVADFIPKIFSIDSIAEKTGEKKIDGITFGSELSSGILATISSSLNLAMTVYSAISTVKEAAGMTAQARWGVGIDLAADGLRAATSVVESSFSIAETAGSAVASAVGTTLGASFGLINGVVGMASSAYGIYQAHDAHAGLESAGEVFNAHARRVRSGEFDAFKPPEYRRKKLNERKYTFDIERIESRMAENKGASKVFTGIGAVATVALLLTGVGSMAVAATAVMAGIVAAAVAVAKVGVSFIGKQAGALDVVDRFLGIEDMVNAEIEKYKNTHGNKISAVRRIKIRNDIRHELVVRLGFKDVKSFYVALQKQRAHFLHRKLHERLYTDEPVSFSELESYKELIKALGLKFDQSVDPPMPTLEMIEKKLTA